MRVLIIVFALTGVAFAQQPSPAQTPGRMGVWQADLPGGAYIVRLAAITSLSMHDYVVDNTAKVTEVTIATSGSEIARFYFIEPNTPKAPDGVGQSGLNLIEEKVREIASRTGADGSLKNVIKSYPTSTHAHTIEYRVESKEMLTKLFESAKEAWLRDNGGKFKP